MSETKIEIKHLSSEISNCVGKMAFVDDISASQVCCLQDFIHENSERVWIQNINPHHKQSLISGEYSDISVIKISLSDYEDLAFNEMLSDNSLYITDSDYIEAYGQTIENLSTSGVEDVSQAANISYVAKYFVNKDKVGYSYDKASHAFKLSVDGNEKVLSIPLEDVFEDKIINKVEVKYNEEFKCNVIRIYFDDTDKDFIDIKISDLVQVYKAGNGIEISNDASTILSISVKEYILSSCDKVSANYKNWDNAYDNIKNFGDLSGVNCDNNTLSICNDNLQVNIPNTTSEIKKHINILDDISISSLYCDISSSGKIDDIKIEDVVSAFYQLLTKLK